MSAPESGRSKNAPAAEDYSHLSPRGQALVGRFRETVVGLVADGSPGSVLEVGCGQGWLLALIADALPDAVLAGLDIRPEAIEYARGLVPLADLTVGDGVRLPYADGSFEVVVCSEVLEHVDEPHRVLAEIRRVGSGRAVISVPHEPWFWGANLVRGKYLATLGNCPGHIQHFTRGALARVLRRHFSEVTVSTSLPWLIADVRW
jgi:ubiquinone/menaquinone biosynthesis C-methylase UbiE